MEYDVLSVLSASWYGIVVKNVGTSDQGPKRVSEALKSKGVLEAKESDPMLKGDLEAKGSDPTLKGLTIGRVSIKWMSNHWDCNCFIVDS